MRTRRILLAGLVAVSLGANAFILAQIAARWVVEDRQWIAVAPPTPAEHMAGLVSASDAAVLRRLWPAYDQAFAARYADWKDARREVDAALAAPTAEPGRLERAFARLRASQAELEATVQGFVVAAAPHLSADARARIAAIRAPR